MSPKAHRPPNVAALARRPAGTVGTPQVITAIERAIHAQRWDLAFRQAHQLLRTYPEGSPVSVRAAYLAAIGAFQMRLYDDAITLTEYVTLWAPGSPEAWQNLAQYYHAANRLADAATAARRALLLRPEFSQAEVALGALLEEQGDTEGAALCFARALARPSSTPEADYNRSPLALRAGDFARGWPWYEARWRCPAYVAEYGRPDLTAPRWTPETAPGHGYVWGEQGFGDQLQFARYVPPLLAAGHQVTLAVHPALVRLAQAWTGPGLTIQSFTDPPPAHDWHAPLLSIAAQCTPDLGAIPPVWPLPIAPRALPGERRVGLCWAGSERHHGDRLRSAPLHTLPPLLAAGEAAGRVTWVNLVHGPRAVDFTRAVARHVGSALDPMPAVQDWADTAAIVAACDVVVTVDTGLAHLAATLGRPTLILLPVTGEWRWLEGRTDSPWYPSATLVRHPAGGDWAHVLQTAATLLPSLLG